MTSKLTSAPTGSGKTTIFDLAFLRMLHAESSLLEYESRTTYAIYLAPTKVSPYPPAVLICRPYAASVAEIGTSDSKTSAIAMVLVPAIVSSSYPRANSIADC